METARAATLLPSPLATNEFLELKASIIRMMVKISLNQLVRECLSKLESRLYHRLWLGGRHARRHLNASNVNDSWGFQ